MLQMGVCERTTVSQAYREGLDSFMETLKRSSVGRPGTLVRGHPTVGSPRPLDSSVPHRSSSTWCTTTLLMGFPCRVTGRQSSDVRSNGDVPCNRQIRPSSSGISIPSRTWVEVLSVNRGEVLGLATLSDCRLVLRVPVYEKSRSVWTLDDR